MTFGTPNVEILNDSIQNVHVLENVLNKKPNNNDIEVEVLTFEDVLNDWTIGDIARF